MFDRIAPRYDRLNTLFSLDRDRAWRKRAAAAARLEPGQTAVDLCTGTGKLAHELLARVRPGGQVIGVDFSSAMLEVARAREPAVRFLQGDVAALPLPDAVAHAVTIAFGYRNLVDRAAGLREMHRILKPGGRLVISDVVQERDLGRIEDDCGCVGNAMVRGEYLETIRRAGFAELRIVEDRPWRTGPSGIEASAVTLIARKPGREVKM